MRKSKDMPYHIGLVLKLYPSDQQKHIIAVNDGAQRAVYNFLVYCGNEIFRMSKTADLVPAYQEKMAYLKEMSSSTSKTRAALPFLAEKEIDCHVADNARKNYVAAWKRMKSEHAGIPVFHKKSYEQSYQTNCHYRNGADSLLAGTIHFEGRKHIFLPKLGRTRCAGSPEMLDAILADPKDTRIGTVTISRDAAGEYWCSLAIASEHPFRKQLPKTHKSCGIDLNIIELANSSDGSSFANPKYGKAEAGKVSKAQRKLSRRAERAKKEGRALRDSRNYQKQRAKVARINIRISRRRDDYLNCVSKSLVESQDLVAAEDLQVRNLMKNHHLARSIADCGWRKLLTMLQQKADMYGKTVILVPPQYTTQTCSTCGHVLRGKDSLPLSARVWTCPVCGTYHLRDMNAGQVILQKAVKMLPAV